MFMMSHIFSLMKHMLKQLLMVSVKILPWSWKNSTSLNTKWGWKLYKISILLQNCYLFGYFPKCWKQDNRIYIKKLDKANYHLPNYYRPILLSNFLDKVYEKIIQQEATNKLTENNFFEGKNVFVFEGSIASTRRANVRCNIIRKIW